MLLVPVVAVAAVARSVSLRTHELAESTEQLQYVRLLDGFSSEASLLSITMYAPDHVVYEDALAWPEQTTGEALVLLLRMASPGDWTDRFQRRTLPRMYGAWTADMEQAVALVNSGQVARAQRTYFAALPLSHRLMSLIRTAATAQAQAAATARRAAFVGDLTGYGGASLAILLIIWYLWYLRRRRERRLAEVRLGEATERFKQVVQTASEGVWMIDADHNTTFVNAALAGMLGYEPAEMLGRPVVEFIDSSRIAEATRVLAARPDRPHSQVECPLRGLDGRRVWVILSASPMLDGHGAYVGALGMVTNISERKEMEVKLAHLADHDPLTGLRNRRAFRNELERQLVYQTAHGRGGAVLMLDLDNFKVANDTYGHATGDSILIATAEILNRRARTTDVVARIGGDEFVVLLPEAAEDDALKVASDIRSLLCERQIGPPIMTSIGITTFGDEPDTADDVMVCADTALYEAKERGGDQARVYHGQAHGVLRWVQRIQNALDEGQFVLHGQPIIDPVTGTLSHLELLLRMIGDDGELIAPGSFLPTAERFGVIREIDQWVTESGLRLAREGHRVAINLSGQSIGRASIIDAVRRELKDGLDPGNVSFEITETSALSNLHSARLFAGTLKGLGCRVALDDFGAGFGSFTYLKHIPAQYVKIDREFVHELTHSTTDQAVVKSIVQVAHSLGKQVIAEGIEDAETLAAVVELGVDLAQGFYLGRPAPVSTHSSEKPFPNDLAWSGERWESRQATAPLAGGRA